jgi:hypothetical protein
MLKNLWGTATVIAPDPGAPEEVRLKLVATIDFHQVLADSSRDAPEDFQTEMRLWSGASMTGMTWRTGKLSNQRPDRFTFDVDACVDDYRTNSHCGKS